MRFTPRTYHYEYAAVLAILSVPFFFAADIRLSEVIAAAAVFFTFCHASVADRMQELGFYCCTCVFPAVPMNRPGIRFTVTRHNEPADVQDFVAALAESVESLKRAGMPALEQHPA